MFDGHIYDGCYMQMYYGSALLFTRKLHCLQASEHMSALLAIKALVFVKLYISTRVFEILRETCKRYFN